MAVKVWLPVLALVAVHGADAVTYLQRSQYCVAACSAALNHVSFDGKKPASASLGSPVPCTDKHYIESLFYCAAAYCTPEQARSGLDYNNETCLSDAGKPLPSYATSMERPPSGAAGAVMRVSEMDVRKRNFTQPVVPSQEFFNVGYESAVSR